MASPLESPTEFKTVRVIGYNQIGVAFQLASTRVEINKDVVEAAKKALQSSHSYTLRDLADRATYEKRGDTVHVLDMIMTSSSQNPRV